MGLFNPDWDSRFARIAVAAVYRMAHPAEMSDNPARANKNQLCNIAELRKAAIHARRYEARLAALQLLNAPELWQHAAEEDVAPEVRAEAAKHLAPAADTL